MIWVAVLDSAQELNLALTVQWRATMPRTIHVRCPNRGGFVAAISTISDAIFDANHEAVKRAETKQIFTSLSTSAAKGYSFGQALREVVFNCTKCGGELLS